MSFYLLYKNESKAFLMRKLLTLLLLSASVPIITIAQNKESEEMETDRPSHSLTPKTVVENRFQAEVGVQKEFDKSNGLKEENYLYPTALLKYGLSKKLEVRVLIEDEGDYAYIPNKQKISSGIKPVRVGLKYNLMEKKGAMPTTSIIANAAIPKFASPDFKGDYVAPAFRLAMENSLSKKVSLVYNLGVQWEPEDVHAQYLYTICPEFEITDKLSAFAEVYGFFSSEESADHRFDGGLFYKLKPNFQIDFSGGLGITKTSPDSFIEAGISFRLPH